MDLQEIADRAQKFKEQMNETLGKYQKTIDECQDTIDKAEEKYVGQSKKKIELEKEKARQKLAEAVKAADDYIEEKKKELQTWIDAQTEAVKKQILSQLQRKKDALKAF